MQRIFITAATVAAFFATLPAGAADNIGNYQTSLKCVSLHVIAGQVLGQDAQRGEAFAEIQADEASDFFGFAQASRPTLSKADIDADLSAQLDEDYGRITAEGADIEAFLDSRVPVCKQLKKAI